MSLAQENDTPTRPRIEPGSPDPESDALTTRPVRSPTIVCGNYNVCSFIIKIVFDICDKFQKGFSEISFI